MKTIIAGSRDISRNEFLDAMIGGPDMGFITEVVSGTARGVDTYGEEFAECNDIPIKRFPANWAKFGRSAGFRRNRQMAEYAEALVAVWDGESKGTKNMINQARNLGLQVIILYT